MARPGRLRQAWRHLCHLLDAGTVPVIVARCLSLLTPGSVHHVSPVSYPAVSRMLFGIQRAAHRCGGMCRIRYNSTRTL